MLSSTGRLAGRQRELARLAEIHADVPRRGVRLALVEGPAGVGRGRLAEELGRHAGAITLTGTCEERRPWGPFESILTGAFDALSERGCAPAAAADLACERGCHRLWLAHRGDDAADASVEQVRLRRLRAFAAAAELLAELARVRPVVVVVRDLERADPESLELLRRLLDAPPAMVAEPPAHLMLVATLLAGDDHADGIEHLRAHPRAVRVPLLALDEAGMQALLSSPEVLARVLARTGGSPRALERLLAAELPTAGERLTRSLGGLSSEARAALDALAVVGGPREAARACRLAGVEPHSGVVPELVRSGLVAWVDGTRLAVVDASVSALLVERLAPERLATLHLRAADDCAADDDPARAVDHALAGGDLARARALTPAACDRLTTRGAHAAAADLVERVLAVADGDVALLDRVAQLRWATGEYPAALVAARRVVAARPGEVAAILRVAELCVLVGDHEGAARTLQDARARIDAPRAVELDVVLAELHYQSGRHDAARALVADALSAASDAGLAALALDLRNTQAKLALAADELSEAARLFAACAREAGALADPRRAALAHGGLGVTAIKRGTLDDAEASLRRCAQLAAEAGDHKSRTLAQHNLAVVAHMRHDYQRARERYEEALRLLRVVGNRTSLARASFNLGELYETLGDHGRARTMCDLGAQAGGADVSPAARAEGLLLRGRVETAEGDLDAARAALEAAHALLVHVDATRAAAAVVALARVDVAQGQLASADARLSSLPDGLGPARLADAARARALLEQARGEDFEAAAVAAVAAAERADDDALLVEALVLHARALAESGRQGDAQARVERALVVEASLSKRVPDDLKSTWDDRPVRRDLLALQAGRLPAPRPRSAPSASASASAAAEPRRSSRIVGGSRALAQVLAMIERVGPSDCTVLVRGESGTGKELVAEALHQASERRDRPLVRVNCAALVETLLLSELFGHERGAFTGAHARKKGRFELADGGTIFLDEIGDISPNVQAALLRVLQERRFERVGGLQTLDVDVRVVAATHRDLEAMVRAGTFREDLYYRLDGVTIELPPLRERPEDIPTLCEHFLAEAARERGESPRRLEPAAVGLLAAHAWPGNVRELANVLKAASLFADGPIVRAADLPIAARGAAARAPRIASPTGQDIYDRVREGELTLRAVKKEIERECIERALDETSGNISRAAGLLGMKRPRLSQLIKEYGLRSNSGDAS